MGVSLEKLQQDAPHLVETVNMVKQISVDNGLDPDTNTAAVVATFDLSGSNEMGGNRNYSGGTMQKVGDYALAAAFAFDDDGLVPFSYFHSHAIDLGNITPETSKGFVERTWQRYSMGGTSYLSALDWIIGKAGYDGVDLGQRGEPLRVRATAPYPTFAIFATDGEPSDREQDIEERIRRMSQLPIFVQFAGVGEHRFDFLNRLNKLNGRLIDNAGFFDSKDVLAGNGPAKKRFGFRKGHGSEVDEQTLMLSALLNEFPSYYKEARSKGLIVR